MVEIADHVRAVMADDGFRDRPLQPVFAGQFAAVDDMFADFRAAFDGRKAFMRILLPFDEIFDEEFRIAEFADVVEGAADFGEQLVGANGLRGVIGELPDLHAVVVSPLGFVVKSVQQRMIHRTELMERDGRDDVEEAFAQRREEEEGDHDEESVGEGQQEELGPEMRPLDWFIRMDDRAEHHGPFIPYVVHGRLPEEEERQQQQDDDELEASSQETVAFRDVMEDDDTAEGCDDGMDEQRVGAFAAQ